MIRAAEPHDVDAILQGIRDLAAYEKLEHEVDASLASLRDQLFGPRPIIGAFVAEEAGRVVGFALYFSTYSTFKTAPCLHLEDLFVEPDYRGKGLGEALLRAVAAEAERRECPRLTWNVLDWNEPAIGFYRRMGADVLPDWRVCRVEGSAIARMAGSRS